ncbi:hypothetical protein GCM10011297_33290 [Bacterioplanes sanyensis]|uniref:UPF0231 family protein n=1 Tax=Bacterioplanes sanyensis TaxID=1249553 RepID=UPI001679DD12|nr:YacL family protein [Bacterioplanes sanyensis]GGY57822.1 hypothetical protein GCM10011297_33290 [Bacterioplanes sanyensis]
MDYRFFYNERQLPCARLSMDHEAFGFWLSDDLGDDLHTLAMLLEKIDALLHGELQEFDWHGHDFLLKLSREDADVIAHELLQEHSLEELNDEDMDFYDAESRASCGLEDFKDLLIEWRDFLED